MSAAAILEAAVLAIDLIGRLTKTLKEALDAHQAAAPAPGKVALRVFTPGAGPDHAAELAGTLRLAAHELQTQAAALEAGR